VSLDERPHKPLWFRKTWSDHFQLQFLSPEGYDSDEAALRATPNDASAVVLVQVGLESIMFCGDAGFRVWDAIHALVGHRIRCAITTVPHHGGLLGQTTQHEAKLRRLFQQIIQPKWAIVSVGSHYSEDHPRKEILEALVISQVHVLCTEITPRCWSGPLEEIPGARTNGWGGVCCAGSIEASIPWNGPTVIHDLNDHAKLATAIKTNAMGTPRCR